MGIREHRAMCSAGEEGHGLGTCQGTYHYEYVSLEAVCWLQYCLLKTTNWFHHQISLTSLVAQTVKSLHTMQETQVWSLGQEDLLEKEIATHSSILTCKAPWTEEPGGLQSRASQRVSYNWTRMESHFFPCFMFCLRFCGFQCTCLSSPWLNLLLGI